MAGAVSAKKEAWEEKSYGGKKILQKKGDLQSAFAVAKTPADNQKIKAEFEALKKLELNGIDTVLASDELVYFDDCAGYKMKWIDGLHSKVDKVAFLRLLRTLHEEASGRTDNAKDSLDTISDGLDFMEEGIGDLQLMLELATGNLFVLDPTGFSNSNESSLAAIKRLKEFLDGTNKQKLPGENYKKFD